MKKLARALGIAGAVAAVLWVVRDRLLAILMPREPEPPVFTVVSPTPQDLTTVNGVGPVAAAKLRQEGITTFADLAAADPVQLAERIGTSQAKIADWIKQAKSLA